jgi:hypothetical protein
MRGKMGASDPSTGKRGQQWREEYEIATSLLKCFLKDMKLKEATGYVARTNSLKCCASRRNSEQAPTRLFDNCANTSEQKSRSWLLTSW